LDAELAWDGADEGFVMVDGVGAMDAGREKGEGGDDTKNGLHGHGFSPRAY